MGAAVATEEEEQEEEEGGTEAVVAVVVVEEGTVVVVVTTVADSAAVADMIVAAGEAGAGAGALLEVAGRGQGRLEAAGEVGAVGLPGAHGRGRAHTTDVEGRVASEIMVISPSKSLRMVRPIGAQLPAVPPRAHLGFKET